MTQLVGELCGVRIDSYAVAMTDAVLKLFARKQLITAMASEV